MKKKIVRIFVENYKFKKLRETKVVGVSKITA